MIFHEVSIFALIASLLVVSPGPNGLLVLMTVSRFGQPGGFANITGFAAAFLMHGTLSVLGLSVLLAQSTVAFFTVKTLGATYLCWIGAKALWSAMKPEAALPAKHVSDTKRSLRRSFWAGFMTNGLNPKVSLFYLAAFPQFLPSGPAAMQSAYVLIAIHILIATAWFTLVVIFSAKVGRSVERGGIGRWLNGLTGIAFIGFGVSLLKLRADT